MPSRSPGCYACRKRKIRCDERRPGCQRCATHGIPCPGYRGDGIEFKDLTDVTGARARGEFKREGKGRRSAKGGGGGDVDPKCSRAASVTAKCQQEGRRKEEIVEFDSPETWTVLAPNSKALTTNRSPNHSPSSLPPLPFFSPAAERLALYQSFIDNYLPRNSLRGVQEGHFSFFQTLAAQRPTHPALQHGFDALSLVQIGSTHHNARLLQQGTRAYALALRALAASLARGNFLQDDEVLAAVVVLGQCELYDAIQVQGQGWSNHVAGANQLVAARGPESIQSELALLLFANMRHAVMCHALIERKAPFMARKEWRDVAWRVPLKKDQSSYFYDRAIRVPGLLERHDGLDLEREEALDEVVDLLAESAEIEYELRTWFTAWEAIAAESFGGLCKLVPITDFPTFLGLCNDDTFDMAFRFPDFLIGFLQTSYWIAMHCLRTNVQSLHKKRHQLQADWYPDPADEVHEDELLEYILNLCRSIPSFCEPENSSTGSIGIFLPMRTAAMYFTSHGNWRLLKWIGSVRNNVFVKGLRPPAVDGKAMPINPPSKIRSSVSPPSS